VNFLKDFDTLIIAVVSILAVVATAFLSRRNDRAKDIWIQKAKKYEEIHRFVREFVDDVTADKKGDYESIASLKGKSVNKDYAIATFDLINDAFLWADSKTFHALKDLFVHYFDGKTAREGIEIAADKVLKCMRKDLGIKGSTPKIK
jgi:hypothetical protein